ncbi:MAG: hypothetical protein Q4C04_01470 [Clostridia bacterium]|nr:hypothetical protein [Clostridia bacterium]
MEQKTMPTQQDAIQHHARLMQAIEEVFTSRGLKYKVSYEKAGQFSAIIPVKFPRKTEHTKKE